MIFYCIGDSVLAGNELVAATLHYFECWMEHHPTNPALASTAQENHPQLEYFVGAMKRTTVLANPVQLEFQGVREDLCSDFLCVEDFPEMQSFSGPFVAYDARCAAYERIYLRLFMEHGASDMDNSAEKLKEMFSERLQILWKRKSILN